MLAWQLLRAFLNALLNPVVYNTRDSIRELTKYFQVSIDSFNLLLSSCSALATRCLSFCARHHSTADHVVHLPEALAP